MLQLIHLGKPIALKFIESDDLRQAQVLADKQCNLYAGVWVEVIPVTGDKKQIDLNKVINNV